MNLVIVELPAKAKTIKKYLGAGYEVLASYGHVRDLPSKDGSVRPDDDFAMDWDIEPKAARHLKDIADAAKRADKLILATDPDREGEAISWHVLEVLKARGLMRDLPVERVAFNAVTKKAVLEAIAHPRGIDRELVDAYLARRALDYLVGFTLSPVLWRKVPGSRSAGRVQSVALRLVCEREIEIEKFVREEYWTVETLLRTARGESFTARLAELEGDEAQEVRPEERGRGPARQEPAREAAASPVKSLEQKPARRNPPPPFITSSLQQEAARKFSLPAARTMQIAQRLYEGIDIGGETQGLITYMRTDGVQMAPEAVDEIRAADRKALRRALPAGQPAALQDQGQERPGSPRGDPPHRHRTAPRRVARALDADQAKLYELIWKRSMASQMESAEFERTTAEIDAAHGRGAAARHGLGRHLRRLSRALSGERRRSGQRRGPAPAAAIGRRASLSLVEVKPEQHFTEPPPRYSEASLVKRLEELGIGRPSTYATILSVLRDRDYVRMDRGRFVPEDKGRIVTAFLEGFFRRYVEYDFTAGLEEKLDLISAGELSWKDLLRDFWRDFTGAVADIKDLKISDVIDALNEILGPHIFPPQPGGGDPRRCPLCSEGQLSLKLGKFGAFIGCSNYPDCSFTRALAAGAEGAAAGPKALGGDPETGEPVTLRTGRFGPYVQRGAA